MRRVPVRIAAISAIATLAAACAPPPEYYPMRPSVGPPLYTDTIPNPVTLTPGTVLPAPPAAPPEEKPAKTAPSPTPSSNEPPVAQGQPDALAPIKPPVAALPPAEQPSPAPPAGERPKCPPGDWWRICHFL